MGSSNSTPRSYTVDAIRVPGKDGLMRRAARFQTGSVVFDKRRKTWNYLWCQDGKRRSKLIGTLQEYPTKGAAQRAALLIKRPEPQPRIALTVRALVTQYRTEKMPTRIDTRRSYELWLNNHILPKWGDCVLSDVQARPAEMWLGSLSLSPKSRSHIRGLLHVLWDFAMWSGHLPTQRNPIELVTVKGASKRTRKPRSLTVEEFQLFVQKLSEPFRAIALLCVCFGLRISECLGLKWSDVDWLNGKLNVERGIVCGNVDDVKTINSGRTMSIDAELLAVLKAWKQNTPFPAEDDWVFASPVKIGRLPYSYTGVLHVFQKAAARAGIGTLGTHSMRHTFRTWLDSVGTSVGVQQKLMRHADVRTTMNIYGDATTPDMQAAHGKVTRLAIAGVN
jgi:integrase